MKMAGIGCRSACSADEIVALVQLAMREAGVLLDGLAAPEHCAKLSCVTQAAQRLGFAITPVCAARLAAQQEFCQTQSPRVRALTGLGSVAEAAALAAAGAGAWLVLPRIQTPWATCAIASGIT